MTMEKQKAHGFHAWLQLVRAPLPTFSAAMIGYVEAHYGDGDHSDAQKNLLCGNVPFPVDLTGYVRTMMANMMVNYTGNADVDFVTGMIPHHQGAIDMAKVELQFGADPTMQTLAKGIIESQQGEISFMQDWLKKHP